MKLTLIAYLIHFNICFFIDIVNVRYLLRDRSLFFIFFFVFSAFLTETIGGTSLFVEKKVFSGIFNYFQIIECIVISSFFYSIILNSITKTLIIIFCILTVILNVIYIIKFSNSKINNDLFLINCVFFSIMASVYLFQLIYMESEVNQLKNPRFWISTGVLFFYTGVFFLTGLINTVSKMDIILASKLFQINHILNIIYYSLITYGFICQRRLAKSSL
jgi:hypothetical protein